MCLTWSPRQRWLRREGRQGLIQWQNERRGVRDEATHSGRHTTSSPALTAVTVKTFSLCLLCLGVTRGNTNIHIVILKREGRVIGTTRQMSEEEEKKKDEG